MLDSLTESPLSIRVRILSLEQAQAWVKQWEPESCIGHEDTAKLISALLETDIPCRRVSTSLEQYDELLVCQYNGPRLPESATSLPEGARIRWILARVEPAYRFSEGCSDLLEKETY